MSLTETHTLVEPLAALADPTRLQIIDLLRRQDHCVCHLVDGLGLKQSLISHHIGVLRRAGLVLSYPHPDDRRWLYYRLNRDALRSVTSELDQLADEAEYDPTPLPCPIDFAPAARR
jgi:ArsR family transcriptional regulator